MTPTVQLACGPLRCTLATGLGASIAGLWRDDVLILRSTSDAALTDVRLAGCYPLVPFSNRIGHATLLWNGTSHPLVRNFAPEPHAIHGVGWQRPWQLLESGDDFALMSFEHRPDAGWPFAFDCSQALRLGPDALELTLSGTNQSDHPAPFGLGWHPYFVKRPDSHVQFRAGGRWEMGDDKLPTHRTASDGLDVDCAQLRVDHCFDDWHGDVLLRDARMAVRISSSLKRLVVFTHPTRDFIAIEPVSHVNNAVNMAQADVQRQRELGVCILQPGETLSASMRIETGPTT
jgi:aldose 1-epimerase